MQTRTKLALLQLLGGVVGWAWILLGIASVFLFMSALFFDGRWSYFLWAFGGSAVAKVFTRGFMEAQESVHAQATQSSAQPDLDSHAGKWDHFVIFRIHRVRYLKDIETLVLNLVEPPGNKHRGKVPRDADLNRVLRTTLSEYRRRIRGYERSFR